MNLRNAAISCSAAALALLLAASAPARESSPASGQDGKRPDGTSARADGRVHRGGAVRRKVHARIMKRFDTNHDGVLSAEERAAAKEEIRAVRQEIRAKVRAKMLERFDSNGDGRLDDSERAAAREQMKARMKAHRAAHPTGAGAHAKSAKTTS